ncbi:SGNH/GDSL hydrolase family protein [Microbacterium oryzae]|uniref:SGNH/GDSL hydrolase family protein n=1 Tax=Microbacterium oryzae TaxID=743009 RepID=UPI0025B0F370|nr:SGNH/GDSL hydrolase family protein [Microbacterium oryzae]MDN3310617.1 SGNH/GDSL hydrolase family protein [Microbacterium oryzae]
MRTRLAAVLAAIAVGACALAAAPAAAAPAPGTPYVALGDSIASGNGLLPYLDADCLRSKRSYPELLADDLGVPVRSEACSGATTGDALEQAADLAESGALGAATELVTLTVGVNDTAWRDALLVCSDAPIPVPYSCAEMLALVQQTIAAVLSDRIAAVIQAVHASAPGAQIVVTGYPVPFGDVIGSCRLGVLNVAELGIRTPIAFDRAAAAAIDETALRLNEAIAAGVALSGVDSVVYLDVNADVLDAAGRVAAEGFDGHGFCDTGSRWISGFLPAQAVIADRSFHPDAAGQAAYADLVAAVIGG